MGIKTKTSTPLEDPQHRKKRKETDKILEMNLLGLYDRIEIVGDCNCMFRSIQYFSLEVSSIMKFWDKNYVILWLKIKTFMRHTSEQIKTFELFLNILIIWDKTETGENIWKCKLLRPNFSLITIFRSKSIEIHSTVTINPKYKTLNLEYYNRNHNNVLIPKINSSIFINLKRKEMDKDSLQKEEDLNLESQEKIEYEKKTQKMYSNQKIINNKKTPTAQENSKRWPIGVERWKCQKKFLRIKIVIDNFTL